MFFAMLSVVLGLMTLYLWKRLVKDTTGPGRTRRVLTVGSCCSRCWWSPPWSCRASSG